MMFLLLNPRDEDDFTKSHLQEVLKLYSKELPNMRFASNTGKQSAFLEKCVTKSKYCSLVLKSTITGEVSDEILAAITYQIVPADTQYAEIPLAAVTHTHQKKGFGKLIYEELKKRLHNVGIRIIYCWADKESEGFWLKQGFTSLAEVDKNGKTKRLRIKSNIRKALCFPGGSTLMLSHLKKESSPNLASLEISSSGKYHVTRESNNVLESVKHGESFGESVYVDCLSGSRFPMDSITGKDFDETKCSTRGFKRSWEASMSSLQSKRIRASNNHDSETTKTDLAFSSVRKQRQSKDGSSSVDLTKDPLHTMTGMSEPLLDTKASRNKQQYRILLMDICDENKRAWLTEGITKLGGEVTSDGSKSTHIVTGKVRKTLNFCSALCSGAWIVSPSWLKASFREGGFANEASHILQDEEYRLKYETELKSTVLRAKAKPNSLLKGYDICVGRHVELPIKTSSSIIKSAGGNVIRGVDKVKDSSKTIYIGCEEDTMKALEAAKKGVWTFNLEWLMNCVMKQQLEFQVSQFVESL